MSLPRYPEYKDSGVAWLGEVPGHWGVKPVKAVASCNDEVLEEATSADYEIEYVEISGVDAGHGISSTEVIQFGNAPSRARRRVKDGDVLVSTVRTYLRAIAPVINPPENMIASTGFAVIRPRLVVPHFLGYLFQAEFLIAEVIARSVGVSYPAINASDLMRLHMPLPMAEEQQAIAAFLDRETGKIDALVAEQEKLIALLKEKRQAVISHAVTKGLNPNAKMKNSGIVWLGEVPAHWEIKPVKAIATCNDEVLEESTPEDYEIEYIEISGVDASRGITSTDVVLFRDAPSRARRRLKDGDVLVSTVRTYLRAIAPVINPPANMIASTGFAVVRPRHVASHYLGYLFQAEFLISEVIAHSVGVSYPAINASELMRFNVPVPLPKEQAVIAAFLDTETTKFDALTAEANRAIELLQERRSALISAAVTGKIDVRGAVIPA